MTKCEGYPLDLEGYAKEIRKYGQGNIEYFGKLIITKEQQNALDKEDKSAR